MSWDFKPIVPDSYQDAEFLMLGNLAPAVQLSCDQPIKEQTKADRDGYHEFLDGISDGRS